MCNLLYTLRHNSTFQCAEFLVQTFGRTHSTAEFVKFCPKSGTVVEFLKVAEFVGYDVINKVRGEEQEPQTEVDITQGRTTAPTGGNILDGKAVELNVVCGGNVAQALGENYLRVVAQGGCQHFVCPFQTCRAFKPKTLRHINNSAFGSSLDGSVRFPAFLKMQVVEVCGYLEVVVEFEYHFLKGEPTNEARAEDKLVYIMPCKEEVKTPKRD